MSEWIAPTGLDPECEALCRAINDFTDVRTTESCCGHGRSPYTIFLSIESLEALPPLLYWVDSCHSGCTGWTVYAYADCSMDKAKFVLEGPIGAGAYLDSLKIAEAIQVAGREHGGDSQTDVSGVNALAHTSSGLTGDGVSTSPALDTPAPPPTLEELEIGTLLERLVKRADYTQNAGSIKSAALYREAFARIEELEGAAPPSVTPEIRKAAVALCDNWTEKKWGTDATLREFVAMQDALVSALRAALEKP